MPTAAHMGLVVDRNGVRIVSGGGPGRSARWFETSLAVAGTQGENMFAALADEHRSRISAERDRANYAFDARNQAIGRIGLPTVRQFPSPSPSNRARGTPGALEEMMSGVPELNA